MELKKGTTVETPAGESVGHIDRVVMNPRTKEVTHVVVRKGFLFSEDKVVPISLIASTSEDRVMLREDAGDLQQLPAFEETHYHTVNESELGRESGRVGYAPPLYWYPPVIGMGPMTYPYPGPGYVAETQENIPQGTVALKEGAKVISSDGKHVGNVERIFTEPQADRATHLLISRGLLLKERKLVPMSWVSDVTEDEAYLSVGSGTLEELREYQES